MPIVCFAGAAPVEAADKPKCHFIKFIMNERINI